MKLQDKLPEGVTVDGRFYKMDFDFRNVLRMIEELEEKNIFPEARAYNALKCVCKRPRNVLRVAEAVKDLLFTTDRRKGQKITDFVQDAGLIRAAFKQAYGMDLYRDHVHWLEFMELLSAIPNDTRYSEVVSIRAREIPAPTNFNQKEREWLIRAKADVALRTTEDEQETQYKQDVANVGAFLMSLADGGE